MRVFTLSLLALTACASGSRGSRAQCEPIPADYTQFGEVYRDCDVDQRVRVISAPRPDFTRLEPLMLSPGSSGCYRADFTFIVDAAGNPVAKSVRVTRSNSVSFAQATQESLHLMRFEPAKKNGLPVPQLFKYGAGMRYMVSMAGTGSRRPPPC